MPANDLELAGVTRILHLLTEADSVFAESARAAITGQLAAGHQVAVAARSEVLDRLDLNAHPELRRIEVPAYPQPRPSDPQTAFTLHKLYRYVDVVHAHGLHAAALAGLGLTGLPRRLRPVIIDTVGNARPSDYFSASRRKFVARTASAVLGSNDAVVAEFAAAGQSTGRAPLLSPDIERRVHPTRSKAGTRARLKLDGDVMLVATPIELRDGDALTTITEAALRLPQVRADRRWAFAFTGSGAARATLEAELVPRAPQLKLVSPSETVDVLAAADIVIAADSMTGIDPAGLMQLRRPVVFVGSEDGAAAYGDAAVTVAATDTRATLAGIEYFADSPVIRTQLAFQAADRVLGTCEPGQVPQLLASDYARALETSAKPR